MEGGSALAMDVATAVNARIEKEKRAEGFVPKQVGPPLNAIRADEGRPGTFARNALTDVTPSRAGDRGRAGARAEAAAQDERGVHGARAPVEEQTQEEEPE